MTDPTGSGRDDLLDEKARIVSQYDQQAAEYNDEIEAARPIRDAVAAAERAWKPVAARWDELGKPRDGRTIAERGQDISDLERVAADRLRLYPPLAAATTELIRRDYRIARLERPA